MTAKTIMIDMVEFPHHAQALLFEQILRELDVPYREYQSNGKVRVTTALTLGLALYVVAIGGKIIVWSAHERKPNDR